MKAAQMPFAMEYVKPMAAMHRKAGKAMLKSFQLTSRTPSMENTPTMTSAQVVAASGMIITNGLHQGDKTRYA